MLFRPSFCANCGEKIERAEWGLLTSRRFCQLCETEFKGADYLPRVAVGAGILAVVLGFGTYLKSGSVESQLARQTKRSIEPQNIEPRPDVKQTPPPVAANAAASAMAFRAPLPSNTTDANRPPSQTVKSTVAVADDAYTCGAETKKGTPCSRRVKGNVRCFQHTGMPAMLSADRLKIRQQQP